MSDCKPRCTNEAGSPGFISNQDTRAKKPGKHSKNDPPFGWFSAENWCKKMEIGKSTMVSLRKCQARNVPSSCLRFIPFESSIPEMLNIRWKSMAISAAKKSQSFTQSKDSMWQFEASFHSQSISEKSETILLAWQIVSSRHWPNKTAVCLKVLPRTRQTARQWERFAHLWAHRDCPPKGSKGNLPRWIYNLCYLKNSCRSHNHRGSLQVPITWNWQ